MQELQMFPPAVEAASCLISRDERGFWSLRIAVKLEGDQWRGEAWQTYSRLSLGELLDIVQMELSGIA